MFTQTLAPLGNLWLTVAAAFLPLALLLFLLAGLRMTAWLATWIGGAVTLLLGAWVWHAPLRSLARAYLYGGLQGIWSIDWITFWGLVIFNTLVLTGDFERFKNWLIHHATADIRIQTLMLAWAFGALLEGIVGFGYPWAVVAPILIGFGIADLDAVRVAALANNAPVSFGALGAPILALAAVTGLPLMELSASVGHIVAVLALLPPWLLLYLVSGVEGMLEAWPLALVGSLAYILGQWPVAVYLGPYLPDVTGALVSFWALLGFTKLWRPRHIRGLGGTITAPSPLRLQAEAVSSQEPAGAAASLAPRPDLSLRSSLRAWSPFVALIVVVVAWTGPWSKLAHFSLIHLAVAGISSVSRQPFASAFNLNPLSGGTAILASWLVIVALLRPSPATIRQAFVRTWHHMWGALLVGFFIFGLAFAFVYSGMANSMAYGCSRAGVWFVVLAPILGWAGVALSGSNTTTNAMFGPVQAAAGKLLGLPALLLPSFNSVGAEVGKPVASQTASVGVATSKYVRSEGVVIRHNLGWTLATLAYLILIAFVFYRFFPSLMAL